MAEKLTREIAERVLKEAHDSNPGPWSDHSRYVALACQNIARRCAGMDARLLRYKTMRTIMVMFCKNKCQHTDLENINE